MLNARNLFILVLITIAVGLRVSGLLPDNVAPIAAFALFGGALFSNKLMAFALPISVMIVSDLFVGFHSSMIAVYAAFLLVVLIGFTIRKNPSMTRALSGALAGSILFFLITNAAAWLVSPQYTKDVSGLLNSYAAGVPFFRGTLVGDLLFTGVLFGSYKLAEVKFPSLVKA